MGVIIIITEVQSKTYKVYATLLGIACGLLFLGFLCIPAEISKSVQSALKLCASSLIPSLFPFAVLTGIINGSGVLLKVSRTVGKPFERILGINAESVYALFMGSLGGFPIGAICVRDLHSAGRINYKEAARLTALSSNASPAFCIAVLGDSLFGDRALGVKLYICQVIPIILIGFITGRKYRKVMCTPLEKSVNPLSDVITDAIAGAGITMLKICSFAVFFAVIGEIFCTAVMRIFGVHAAAFFAAVCELTLAGRYACQLSLEAKSVVAAFAVGWSGLSVHMQTASVLSGSGISLSFYRYTKLIQGIASAILIYFFL